MRRLICALVFPVFMTGCGAATKPATKLEDSATTPAANKSGAQSAEGSKDAAPAAFAFGWKIPCSVPVEQVTEKKGSTVRMRYLFTLKPGPEGKLDGDMSDFEFIEVDGHDVTSPDIQAQMAPALALTSAMPTMVISRQGEYVGMRGLEGMIDRVLLFMNNGKKMSKDEAARVATMMRSPMMLATMEKKMGDYWNSWVGTWVGLEMRPSEALEGDDQIPLGDETIVAHLHYEHQGPVEDAPNLVRLSMTSTMSGDSAAAGLLAFTRAAMKEMGMDLPPSVTIDKVGIVNALETDTDPATLRPRHVRTLRTTEIVLAGKTTTKREIREETFDWAHARGCR